ncbi:TPA: phage terminase large subunit [Citrobacter gillenii]
MAKMRIQLSEKFEAMFRPKRIKVFYGGRGGMKTVHFSKIAIICARMKRRKTLCLREFMNSIDDSVHSSLKAEIEELHLSGFFRAQERRIIGRNGSEFRYGQLARNLGSIKSKHGYDVVWVEEAETISAKSLEVLVPTIRKSGSELWFSFNPDDEDGAVYSEFVSPHIDILDKQGYYEDDELFVCHVSYLDNPWLPDELRAHAAKMKATNFKKWLHVYGGRPNVAYEDAIIQPEWVEAAIDAHIKLGITPRGIRVTAFDPADEGSDQKALCKRHGILIEHVEAWEDGDVADATLKSFDEAERYDSDDFIYDNIGMGAGAVKVHLRHANDARRMVVSGFGAGDGPDFPKAIYQPPEEFDVTTFRDNRTNGETFKNKRAQFWTLLALRLYRTWLAVEKGVYSDPDELVSLSSKIPQLKQLKKELCQQQRKRTPGSRFIQILSKEEMRVKHIRSPNMGDVVMMSFANPAHIKKEPSKPVQSRKRNF